MAGMQRPIGYNGQMEIIDTHCHLFMEPLDRDVPGVLERARKAGVQRVVVPAYDQASWRPVLQLAADHPGVHPALGLHPWAAAEDLDLDRLRAELVAANAVVVGEIGLDFKIHVPGRTRQIHTAIVQMKLAAELGLPVILHCRGGFEVLLEVLADNSIHLRGVVHAYSRGPELARRLVDLGLHLGLGGAITRPGARRARRTAQVVPLESILLETDAPSIGLEGVAPEETEPRHVQQVAAALAELRGEDVEEIAERTTANAQRLFGI